MPGWRRLVMIPFRFSVLPFFVFYSFLVLDSANGQASGTWTNAAANSTWGTTTNWASGTVASGVDAVADFSTLDIAAARTVSLGANWTIGSLIFGDATTPSNNWALANGTGGPWTLTLSGSAPAINVVNQTTTISAVLGGTQGFTKSGTGALTLTGANTITGGINLSTGTLNFSTGSLGANVVDFTGNATLGWNGTNTLDLSAQLKIEDGVTATLAIGANNVTFASPIQIGTTGTGSLTKTGAGLLTLTSANTYTGTTKINAGRIILSGGNDRLAPASSFTLGQTTASGVLQLGDATAPVNQTFKSLVTSGSGTANAVVGGNPTNSTLTLNNTAAVTYAGLLGGAGVNENNLTLNKTGSGALTLTNGANTFSGGVTLNQGTLNFATGALGTNLVTFTGAATLQWATGTTTDASTTGGLMVNDGVTATLDANGNTVTLVTPIQTGPLGTAALIKANPGTFIITGANTFTGGTTIRSGTLVLTGGDNRLAPTSAITLGNGTNTNVTLQLGDASGPSNQTITSVATAGTGTNFIKGGNAAISLLTLNNSTAKTFSGTIGSGVAGSGLVDENVALTKTGAGTLTLSGPNSSFVGDVNITGGALIIKASNSLGSGTKNITVVGATNTPSLQLDGSAANIILASGLSLITSNQNSAVPAILNTAGDNIINGTISPTSGGTGAGSTRIKVASGTLSLNGNIAPAASATSARTLILDGAGNGTVNGVIANGSFALALTKDGAGTWSLTNANTFTGAVSVLTGTLEADNPTGSATGTGAVTVSTGATLQGIGRIGGTTTLQSGGFLEAGTATTIGKLTFSNRLNLLDGSITDFHLASTSQFDQIAANQLAVGPGAVSTAAFRVFIDAGYTPAAGDSFKLFDWASLLPGDTNLADNLDLSSAVLQPGFTWDTSNFQSSGILAVVVPEPSRVALVIIGALGTLIRRRRGNAYFTARNT